MYVVLLALIMVIMTSFVYASTDFADVDDESLACATRNLLEMGILSPAKNLGVDEKITRAEMAKLLIVASHSEPTSNGTKPYKEYKDVPTNHWAWGYIDAISRLGYVDNIVDDDYFYPEESVTYREAVAYVLNLLGYSDLIEGKAGNGDITEVYREYANNFNLLRNCTGASGWNDEVTRGNLCIILWNTLHTQVWTILNTNTPGITYGKSDILLNLCFPGYTPTYNVSLNDYEGGMIKVNQKEVLPKEKTTLSIRKAEDYTLTLIPDNGYELGYVKVGGHTYRNKSVTNNELTIAFDDCYDIKIDLYFEEVDIPNESEIIELTVKNEENHFTGKEIALVVAGFDANKMTITGNKGVSVGKYEAIVKVKDPYLYQISYGGVSGSSVKIDWEIVKSFVPTIDVIKREFEYNGKEQEVDVAYNPDWVKVTGNKATKVGEYKAVYSLAYPEDSEWEDGGNEDIIIKWRIVDSDLIEEIVDEEEVMFADVDEKDWYYESVKFAVEEGLFNGVSESEFAPDITMNRAMLVTVLYRLDGEKNTNYKHLFHDVEKNSYYERAVNWATNKKIVSGMSENEFAPFDEITREQLVVMLYRYATLKNLDTNQKANLNIYQDNNEVSDYAQEAMAWAVKKEYIHGRTNTVLAPQETATRAEVAAIFMRFSKEL